MKKFLSISMMALTLVFASSCNKDENGDADASKCVNTWVSDEVALSEIAGEISSDEIEIPEEILAVIAPQLNNMKVRAAVDLAADGKGKAGVIVDKAQLNLAVTAIQTILAQYGDKIDADKLAEINQIFTLVKPMLDNLKDGDYVGTAFTYVATPTDSENGKIAVTYTETDDEGNTTEDTTEVSYSGLSDNTITLTVTGEDGVQTVSLKSAASANITVGNFVDVSAIEALL